MLVEPLVERKPVQRLVTVPIILGGGDQADALEPSRLEALDRLGEGDEVLPRLRVDPLRQRPGTPVRLAGDNEAVGPNGRRQRFQRSDQAAPDEARAEAQRRVVASRLERERLRVALGVPTCPTPPARRQQTAPEMDTGIARPPRGRTFAANRRIRLSDMDASGRLRLDAVARFLQDIAVDDVDETGWGAPEHLWVIRRILVAVEEPFLEDREVELTTWCSGLAAVAAGRRWSLAGDRGGRIEVDSVWIHLGADARPARIDEFGLYAEATEGRRVSTRFELPDSPRDGQPERWPLRATDVDLLGHVNNAAYWHAVEERLAGSSLDLRRRFRAQLDYRQPIDLVDSVALIEHRDDGRHDISFVVGGAVKAVARLQPLGRRIKPA